MNRYRISAVLFILVQAFSFGIDLDNSAYGSISDYLNDIYGIDDNAGLTAFPVLNVPMGGRAEGMASSFSAVADDISFIEYNPAGSAVLPRSELAFFHNNWIADTKVEGLIYSFRLKNLDSLGLATGGKWLYTPFTEYNMYGERESKGYYSEAVAFLNASYNFLADYHFFGLSAGVTLKGAFRFVPDFSDADDAGNYEGSIIEGSGLSQSAVMGMADLGVLTRFDLFKPYYSREKNASAALVVRNLGPPVMGDPLPTVAALAVSYKPLKPLLFSFDFSFPINMRDVSLSEKPYWAAGIAVQVTDFLSMRTGLLSKTGNVRFTIGSAVKLQKIALDVNYTLDLLTQLQPLNRVSIGVRFDMGDNGRQAKSDEVDRLYMAGIDAYSMGQFLEAQRCWNEALKINPLFEPAIEGLRNLQEAIRLEERMDELRNRS
jgi:tetratricopeptide (TPR) repeat protein